MAVWAKEKHAKRAAEEAARKAQEDWQHLVQHEYARVPTTVGELWLALHRQELLWDALLRLSMACKADFGLDGYGAARTFEGAGKPVAQKRLEALHWLVQQRKITPYTLRDALGNGTVLTRLAAMAPNPVEFKTAYDFLGA